MYHGACPHLILSVRSSTCGAEFLRDTTDDIIGLLLEDAPALSAALRDAQDAADVVSSPAALL